MSIGNIATRIVGQGTAAHPSKGKPKITGFHGPPVGKGQKRNDHRGSSDLPDVAGLITWMDPTDAATILTSPDRWIDKSSNGIVWTSVGSGPADFSSGVYAYTGTSGTVIYEAPLATYDDMSLTEGEIFCRIKQDHISNSQGAPHHFNRLGATNHYGYGSSALYIGDMSTTRYNGTISDADLTTWHTLNIHCAANDWALKQDGVTVMTSGTATFSMANISLPRLLSSAFGWKEGYMAGLVMYDHKLSDEDRATVKAYMDALV